MRARLALAAVVVTTVVVAAPAQASLRDCTILGPDYVAEVVDCAFFIVERAINW